MTTTTDQPAASVTSITAKAPRQSRASRGAAQNAKPKASTAKATTKPKSAGRESIAVNRESEPQAKAPSVTAQKEATVQWALDTIVAALADHAPEGVDREQAAAWLGQWMSYFPGCRQGRVTWPERALGPVSMAGARKAR
jgi:hypothetical protein